MKDLVKQELGSQVVEKRTANCKEIWKTIELLKLTNEDPDFVGTKAKIDELLDKLEMLFYDFECAWEQHAKEYH